MHVDKFKKSYEDGKVGLEINEEGKVKVEETTKDINSDSGTVRVMSSDEYYNMLHSTAPVVSTPYNK